MRRLLLLKCWTLFGNGHIWTVFCCLIDPSNFLFYILLPHPLKEEKQVPDDRNRCDLLSSASSWVTSLLAALSPPLSPPSLIRSPRWCHTYQAARSVTIWNGSVSSWSSPIFFTVLHSVSSFGSHSSSYTLRPHPVDRIPYVWAFG